MGYLPYKEFLKLSDEEKSKRVYELSDHDKFIDRMSYHPNGSISMGRGGIRPTKKEYKKSRIDFMSGLLKNEYITQTEYDEDMEKLEWELENFDKWPFHDNCEK